MSSQTLFADVDTEVTAAELIQDLLGGRVIEHTLDPAAAADEAWRAYNDREAAEARLRSELMADDLAGTGW
ncbi:hypothetical protein CFP71_42065 [Amycolatopsis thailandensis]|uniref:Uncharacterized protein n=1 Tax=Amycolatopsis thailandensis TaxID=589330 RepID=A0A229R812_9PSEU|nr:hypothetical protein [Amycolatopsis thailandensis]OXM42777.1 hypothetical protein CFP71_42065 [Amycolatopsis thailandensis]